MCSDWRPRTCTASALHLCMTSIGSGPDSAWFQRYGGSVLSSLSAAGSSRSAAESCPSSHSVSGVRGGVRVRRVAVWAGAAYARDSRARLRPLLTRWMCRSGTLSARPTGRPAPWRVCRALEGHHCLWETVRGRPITRLHCTAAIVASSSSWFQCVIFRPRHHSVISRTSKLQLACR